MKTLKYQQDAINELTDKAVKLLNLGGAAVRDARLFSRLRPGQVKP